MIVEHDPPQRSLSVVIPSFNSAKWLPSTLESLSVALGATPWTAEIVIIDDGSTDDTLSTLRDLEPRLAYPLRVIHQENKGRFLARWEGMRNARYDDLLILDSRLLVHESSFAYLWAALADEPARRPWNGHVVTDPSAPLVGQFWLVPTFAFWSDYLSHPRPMLITADNFDRLPKGTGFLFIRKELFERASATAWPEENAHLTSDDTKVLRYIADETPIVLDPGFSATYRPRTTVRQFLSHGWDRGTLFVDSYGHTRLARKILLVLLALGPVVALGALVGLLVAGQWMVAALIAIGAIALLLVPAALAAVRRCPPRGVLAYLTYVVPFGVFFVGGLLRGLIVHRKAVFRAGPTSPPKEAQ